MIILKYISSLFILLITLLALSFVMLDKETHSLDETARSKLDAEFVSLKYGSVHYQLAGKPTHGTVVLVHGFSAPSYIWDKNIDALIGAGYQVLRFDLYGRGFSARPKLDYTIDLFVEQLHELSTTLTLSEPFHLVGISMGGPVTTRFSHQFPEKIKSLSLLAPLVETPKRFDLDLLSIPLLGEVLSGVVMMPKLANGLANTVYDVASFPDWHERLAEHIHFKGYRRALLSTLRYLSGKSFIEDYRALNETNIPSLLIWGKEDKIVHYEQHEQVEGALPSISFYSLEKTGHLPQMEQASQVNKILIEFINQQ
jgi:pimeloyl-ACP methyl ester carboxylesterase